MKHIKLLLISNIISFLPLFLIDSIYATAWDRAQTSKSGIVDMFEVLPEYLQATSTAENRDFHIKRNERSIGSGAQYYFYMEGGSLTVSMTTDGVFRIGNTILGSSTGNASYPINLAGGTATTGVLPENQGGFGTSTPGYVRQNNGSSTGQTATNITTAGVGTDTATMRTDGVDISPTEKSYLDGLTGNIQTQINTLGTSTPTANSIVRTESGTTTIKSEWIPNTVILNSLTQITTRNYDDLSGTSTIKPTQITIGTTTLQGALNAVGTATFSGTVTAGGFSGNGAGLTGIVVALSNATGSATSTQLPLISGLLGSATSAQLPADPIISGTITASGFSGNGAGLTNISPSVAFSAVTGSVTANSNFKANIAESDKVLVGLSDVIKLPATTTVQASQSYGQIYMYGTTSGALGNGHIFLSHFDNTNTIFTPIPTSITLTAIGNAVGTTTSIFAGNSAYFDGDADGVGLGTSLNGTFDQNFTIDFHIKTASIAADVPFAMYAGSSTFLGVFPHNANGNTYFVCSYGGTSIFDYWIPGGNALIADNVKHHIEIDRDGANFYVFIDGSLKNLSVNTAIGTTSIPSFGATCTAFIGGTSTGFVAYGGITYNSVVGYIDEPHFLSVTSHTGTFTSPTIAYTSIDPHTEYTAQYLDPANGNEILKIKTSGTITTEASYIYCNATTTVFGLGTNTAITATVTAYSGWFDGTVRATAFNVASTEKIKENIKPIKIKPDLLDAEGLAKQNYIAGSKSAWIAANQANYTIVTNEPGTGSVTIVDTATMEADYNNQIELAWASDINQDTYAETVQKNYEKGFWQMFDSVTPRSWNPKDKPSLIRKGFVVEDMPDVVKGDDGQSIDPMALIAYISVVQQTLKADTVFALSTLKELITTGTVTQQKINYCNDRLEVLNP